MIYKVRLKNKEEVAEGTMSFHFEKPNKFDFKAGQHIEITLINPKETDKEGNTRSFSLVNAPHQGELIIATRMRDSAFKRALKNSSPGFEVEIGGPYGSMTLHKDSSKPAVFLAGGIGITPFMSMIRYAAYEKLPHRIYLFYSNRRPEDAAFLDELKLMEGQNKNYRFIGTMTDMQKSNHDWQGERGYINEGMFSKYIGDLDKPIYYIAGPPAMVKALNEMLVATGVSEDNIRFEEFAGY
ncbi:FAD-dependent oxidoreductase [Candidatus Parcubacteria bacterium]|nr:MAG: FAD-dependent oxidoreductase [Candidatus Parcubacteria bacterium]